MQTIRVTRTQKTEIGLLHAGGVYSFDPSKQGHSAVAKRLLDRKFGEEITEADLKKEKRAAEKLKKAAAQAPSAPLASQKEFQKTQADLEAAKAQIAELTERAETAEAALAAQTAQVEELAATLKELEAHVADKGAGK